MEENAEEIISGDDLTFLRAQAPILQRLAEELRLHSQRLRAFDDWRATAAEIRCRNFLEVERERLLKLRVEAEAAFLEPEEADEDDDLSPNRKRHNKTACASVDITEAVASILGRVQVDVSRATSAVRSFGSAAAILRFVRGLAIASKTCILPSSGALVMAVAGAIVTGSTSSRRPLTLSVAAPDGASTQGSAPAAHARSFGEISSFFCPFCKGFAVSRELCGCSRLPGWVCPCNEVTGGPSDALASEGSSNQKPTEATEAPITALTMANIDAHVCYSVRHLSVTDAASLSAAWLPTFVTVGLLDAAAIALPLPTGRSVWPNKRLQQSLKVPPCCNCRSRCGLVCDSCIGATVSVLTLLASNRSESESRSANPIPSVDYSSSHHRPLYDWYMLDPSHVICRANCTSCCAIPHGIVMPRSIDHLKPLAVRLVSSSDGLRPHQLRPPGFDVAPSIPSLCTFPSTAVDSAVSSVLSCRCRKRLTCVAPPWLAGAVPFAPHLPSPPPGLHVTSTSASVISAPYPPALQHARKAASLSKAFDDCSDGASSGFVTAVSAVDFIEMPHAYTPRHAPESPILATCSPRVVLDMDAFVGLSGTQSTHTEAFLAIASGIRCKGNPSVLESLTISISGPLSHTPFGPRDVTSFGLTAALCRFLTSDDAGVQPNDEHDSLYGNAPGHCAAAVSFVLHAETTSTTASSLVVSVRIPLHGTVPQRGERRVPTHVIAVSDYARRPAAVDYVELPDVATRFKVCLTARVAAPAGIQVAVGRISMPYRTLTGLHIVDCRTAGSVSLGAGGPFHDVIGDAPMIFKYNNETVGLHWNLDVSAAKKRRGNKTITQFSPTSADRSVESGIPFLMEDAQLDAALDTIATTLQAIVAGVVHNFQGADVNDLGLLSSFMITVAAATPPRSSQRVQVDPLGAAAGLPTSAGVDAASPWFQKDVIVDTLGGDDQARPVAPCGEIPLSLPKAPYPGVPCFPGDLPLNAPSGPLRASGGKHLAEIILARELEMSAAVLVAP